jgi:hypothetical protein
MDDTGAGKITETKITEVEQSKYVIAAPCPGTLHRVSNTGHENGKKQQATEQPCPNRALRNSLVLAILTMPVLVV